MVRISTTTSDRASGDNACVLFDRPQSGKPARAYPDQLPAMRALDPGPHMSPTAHRQLVSIAIDGVLVEGTLALPVAPSGMVLFAHGSGSSRHSPRNNAVASEMRKVGLGTLLMDLLGPSEADDTAARFDIALLVRRLGAALDWLAENAATRAMPVGVFGASTGAAAALAVAAARPQSVAALVSRGGRPDLAGAQVLAGVRAPTLLIAGSLDTEVILMNHAAYAQLQCEKRIEIVEGATHLFEEPGCLDVVAALAAQWFTRSLAR